MQKSFEVEIWNENALKRFALKMKWSKYSKPRVEGSFYHCVNYFEFKNGFFDNRISMTTTSESNGWLKRKKALVY